MRAITALLAALAHFFAACGDDSADIDTTDAPTPDAPSPDAPSPDAPAPDDSAPDDGGQTGVVAVQLEQIDGIFIEGFEVGLRFETGAGEVVAATLWNDFVSEQDAPTVEDYYDSVLSQDVPAGPVVVLATVSIGQGPGPVTPDIDGDLDCRLDIDVAADQTVEVEVSFDSSGDCLRVI